MKFKYCVWLPLALLILFSCNLNRSKGWEIGSVKISTDSVKMIADASMLQQIYLYDVDQTRMVILLAPLVTDKDTILSNSIIKTLTQKSSVRDTIKKEVKSYWYIFEINNNSKDSNWIMSINNASIKPKLFKVANGSNDTKEEIKRYDNNWGDEGGVVGSLFTITIPQHSKVRFILNLNYEGAPFIADFTLGAYSRVMANTVNKYFFNGFIAALLTSILVFSFYFLIHTKQPVHIAFLSYLAFTLLFYSTITSKDFFDAKHQLLIKVFVLLRLSARYFLLFLIVLNKKKKKKFLLPALTISIIDIILAICTLCFGIVIGWKYIIVVEILFFISYLLYSLSGRNERKENAIFYLTSLIIVLSLSTYFFSNLKFYVAGGNKEYILPATEIIIFFVCTIILYNSFKRRNKDIELNKAIIHQSELYSTIINTLEQERKRFAEDLHDELGSNLAALKMKVQYITEDNGKIKEVLQLLDNTSESVRNISHNLMPPRFAETELKVLLQEYFHHLNSVNKEIVFNFHYSNGKKGFLKDDELIFYRIITELSHNCIKHSKATEVTIQIIYHELNLEILCEDNGSGFKGNDKGIGINNIKSRVQYMKGEITIDSNKRGSTFIIQIPYKDKYE